MTDVYRSSNPTILVILGITGDLARRKLIPALFHLHRKKLLPPLFQIIGFSRGEMSDEALRNVVGTVVKDEASRDPHALLSFKDFFVYRHGLFEEEEGYRRLAEFLGRKDGEWQVCSNKLFYLAVPPQYYEGIFRNLESSGLTEPCSPKEGWTRVIVEKPFGKDLETAERLDMLLGKLFHEEQIYRIDHYLGKETVQNILAFRFSNSFLEPAWDRKSIEHIAIRVREAMGIAGRGASYGQLGALRDVGQNHLLQLLALFTMDRPERFDTTGIRAGRLRALRALKIMSGRDITTNTVRGQYDGYRAEAGASSPADTETYFRIRAFLTSSRWRGVPVDLENGKKMSESFAEIVVTFKHTTPCFCPPPEHFQNILRYRIQPEEAVTLSLFVKRPGLDMVVEEKDFSFDYHTAYREHEFIDPHVDPYRKLLLDTIQGNQTLFVSTDEVRASWKFIDPIVRAWAKDSASLISYSPGTIPEKPV